MRFDLFDLHDNILDNTPRKCIVASGEHLPKEINKHIDNLLSKGWTKRKLVFYFMNVLNISNNTAEKLIFTKREFYYLIFLRKLLELNNSFDKRFELQSKIERLKASQPPEKIYYAVKKLTPELCKIAGAHAADGTIHKQYFSLSEGYLSNMRVLNKWLTNTFGVERKIKQISKNEWKIDFSSKIFTRYLTHILGFPNGYKTDTIRTPDIIHNSKKNMKIAFAKGFMTFESGIGIKNEVELCVLSKNIIDDLEVIFSKAKVKFVRMKKRSGSYCRIWSGKLTQDEAKKWLPFFEENTYKFNRLRDFAQGYTTTVSSFEEALTILRHAFPPKYNNKTSLEKLIKAMKQLTKGTRHDLKRTAGLKDFGGPWNGSLKPYISILEQTKIITTKIGKANGKSCQIYTYNPNIQTWLLPSTEIQ